MTRIKNLFETKLWPKHVTAVVLFATAYALSAVSNAILVDHLTTIICFEVVAVWLCYMFLWMFTRYNFFQAFEDSGDSDSLKAYGDKLFVGIIFASIHILVGLCVFGTYFTRY